MGVVADALFVPLLVKYLRARIGLALVDNIWTKEGWAVLNSLNYLPTILKVRESPDIEEKKMPRSTEKERLTGSRYPKRYDYLLIRSTW